MPAGLSLKARLTLWSLCFLALVLGGSGFFWYHTQQQQLYSRLDAELLSTARDFVCLYNGLDPAISEQQAYCQSLNQLSMRQGGQLAISLYSPEGKHLCSNNHPHIKLLLLPEQGQSKTLSGLNAYDSPTAGETQLRQLTYPVIKNGNIILLLQLASPLKRLHQQLFLFALLLISVAAMTLICFTVLQWFLLGKLLTPLKQLAGQIRQTDEEALLPCVVPATSPAELRLLADSYNSLSDRLNRSLQRARQFSADVTHELRTPLTILRGETELALCRDKDKEELQQVLSSNLEEISRMSHLIEDLLLLSKSELGEVPLRMEALDLGSLLEELYSQAQILGTDKQIEIQKNASEEQISLFADGLRLRQLFLNLLSNAIKYTPEGGRVRISWSLHSGSAQVSIEDSGIGIDNAHQAHIFDRFYRIEKTRNRADGGSGLGLSIAKWIVDAHGGSIQVSSVPGQGSCFTVRLPLTHLLNDQAKSKTRE